MKTTILAAIGLLCACWLASAEAEDAPAPVRPPAIADFTWLEGRWIGAQGAATWEEIWSAPRGNSVMAMTRMIKEGKAGLYELNVIEQDAAGIHLTVAHFGPGVKLWDAERAGSPRWTLVQHEKKRAVFQNDKRDFPRQMIYERSSKDTLTARLVGRREGKPVEMAFSFRLQ